MIRTQSWGHYQSPLACPWTGLAASHFKHKSALSRARSLIAEHRSIRIRTLDLRLRQGIQALETHRLLLEGLTNPDAEPGSSSVIPSNTHNTTMDSDAERPVKKIKKLKIKQ